jgi:hypothetical protein
VQTTFCGVAILLITAALIIHAPYILERPEGQAIVGSMIFAGSGLIRAADAKNRI